MNGNVTILFLLSTLFSHVELLGHGFTEVTECPKSESEVKEASDRLRCVNDTNGNNQYMCLRSRYNIHYLLEFCYDGEMGIVDKGNCLEISEGELKNHSCYYFSEGCPETKFWFYELYKYPACQNIITRSGCDISYVDCPTHNYPAASVSAFGLFSIVLCSIFFLCFVIGFIKAKRHLKGGKWSPQSPDLFSMEAGVYTPTQLEPSSPPPAPPPPPSNT